MSSKVSAQRPVSQPTILHTTHKDAGLAESTEFSTPWSGLSRGGQLQPQDILQLQRTIGNRAAAQLLGRAAPIRVQQASANLLQLDRNKIKRTKAKALSEQQKAANEMMTKQDEADKELDSAEQIWGSLQNGMTDPRWAQMKDEVRKARYSVEAAMYRFNKVYETRTVGAAFDRGVDDALKDYGTWLPNANKRLSTMEDNVEKLEDTVAPDQALSVDDIDNARPGVVRKLILRGKLTIGGDGYWKPTGSSRAFKETDQWSLHLHKNILTNQWEGHYKPTDDEFSVGYKQTNPVDAKSLRRLGVNVV